MEHADRRAAGHQFEYRRWALARRSSSLPYDQWGARASHKEADAMSYLELWLIPAVPD